MANLLLNDYQNEQLETIQMVRHGLLQLSEAQRSELAESIRDYMRFRQTVDDYLNRYFNKICTKTCYDSQTSACCSKDGIITFFADTVVNALHADSTRLDHLESVLHRENRGHRCVYLSSEGCAWTVRPVVCAMFLCDSAMDTVFSEAPEAKQKWERLREQEKRYKWPDRPVLYDHLEKVFLELGYRSSLMHLNFSPGLLNVKKKAGLIQDSK